MKIKCEDEFLVRITRLPFEDYLSFFISDDKDRIINYYRENFKLDILLGSDSLYNQIEKDETINEKIYLSLLKYLIRSATRTTPYGSFAAVTKGKFSVDSSYTINDRYIYPKFDYEWLNKLIHLVELEFKDSLLVKVNNTLLKTNSKIYNTWVSCYSKENNFKNQHISIDRSDAVDIVLNNSKEYIKKYVLYEKLKKTYSSLTIDIFNVFFDDLLKNEILISNIRNCFFNEKPLDEIVKLMNNSDITTNSDILKKITNTKQVERLLLDERNLNIVHQLQENLRYIVPNKCVVKWDSKINSDIRISKAIKQDIEEYIGFLYNYSDQIYPYADSVLKFKDVFNEAFIPIEVALSSSKGIGIPRKKSTKSENQTLLEQSIIMREINSSFDISNIKLNNKIKDGINYQNGGEISFYLLKNDDKFRYITSPLVGSTIKEESIGRFKYMFESNSSSNTDVVQNVVIRYMPKKSRISNVFGNVDENDMVLEYGLSLDNDDRKYINKEDILVGVKNNKFIFVNQKTGKPITFFTKDKVNINFMPTQLQFLIDASKELLPDLFQLHREIWTLSNNNKIFPRVCYKDFVISPKTWNLNLIFDKKIFKSYDEFLNYFKLAREKYAIPKLVNVEKGDQRILLDITLESHLKIIYNLTKSNFELKMYENFIDNNVILQDKNRKSYLGEFVFQFDYEESNDMDEIITNNFYMESKRFFNPFDEYVTLRINIQNEFENDLLIYTIDPIIKKLKYLENKIDTFFFVRYNDEKSNHLRLRIHFNKDNNLTKISILKLCKQLDESGYDLSYEFLPYNRELERYGDNLIIFFERIFDITSEIALSTIANINSKIFKLTIYDYFILITLLILKDFNYETISDSLSAFKLSRNKLKEYSEQKKLILSIVGNGNIDNMMETVEGMKIFKIYDEYRIEMISIWEKISFGLKKIEIETYMLSVLHMFYNRMVGINRIKEREIMGLIESVIYSIEGRKKYKIGEKNG